MADAPIRLIAGFDVSPSAEAAVRAVAGLRVSCEVMPGAPKRVLVEEARKTPADCIFVGSRGLSGGLERLMMGSVSTALVGGAPCSVEVVRV